MTATVPAILKYLSDSSNFNVNQNIDMPARAKKRRLDHLSWEEKVQRKKLKNRVAAQTSRDRKKARMDQMEKAIQDLFAKNETLMTECDNLKHINERLSAENSDLRIKLRRPCAGCAAANAAASVLQSQNRTVECEAQSGSAESLLRPQGTATHSAAALARVSNSSSSNTAAAATTTALLKIVLACLLYRTSSTSSTPTWTSHRSNSSRRVYCRISPETWRLLLKRQIVKNQKLLVSKTVLEKWWGRHQQNWNPVGVTC